MRGNGKLLYMKLENLHENTKKLEGNGSKTETGRLELAISYVVKQYEADIEKKVCLRRSYGCLLACVADSCF